MSDHDLNEVPVDNNWAMRRRRQQGKPLHDGRCAACTAVDGRSWEADAVCVDKLPDCDDIGLAGSVLSNELLQRSKSKLPMWTCVRGLSMPVQVSRRYADRFILRQLIWSRDAVDCQGDVKTIGVGG